MRVWAVWLVSFSLAAVQDSTPRTLNNHEADEFPSTELPSETKKICSRSIFMTPTIIRCPERYQYNSHHGKCIKRFRLVITEEQLLRKLNTMYGPQKNGAKPPGPSVILPLHQES